MENETGSRVKRAWVELSVEEKIELLHKEVGQLEEYYSDLLYGLFDCKNLVLTTEFSTLTGYNIEVSCSRPDTEGNDSLRLLDEDDTQYVQKCLKNCESCKDRERW